MDRLGLSLRFPSFFILVIAGILAVSLPPVHGLAQDPPADGVALAVAEYSPIPVDFQYVSVRAAAPPLTVQIENLGGADLIISSITSTDPAFTVNKSSLPAFASGERTEEVDISFVAAVAGEYTGYIIFESNDFLNPVYKLPVQGIAVDVTIAINPPSLLLVPNQASLFQAALTGAPDTSVTWEVIGDGTITASGLYTAPALAGVDTIRATSVVDPATSTEAQVTILAPESFYNAGALAGDARFGANITTTYLDGGPYAEVVVGAPGTDVGTPGGTVFAAGQVWIRTFNSDGFSDVETFLASPDPVTDGAFGSQVIALDLDGNGANDLIVSEPGGTGVAAGTGAVHVFFGDGAGGFATPVTVADPAGVAGDLFGAAIETGHFAADGSLRLAVGAPGITVVDPDLGALAVAGAVYVVDVQPGAVQFELAAALVAPDPETGAAFGSTLATVCLDGCTGYGISGEETQLNDLLVGAPDATATVDGALLAGAGRVFSFRSDLAATPLTFSAADEVHSPLPAAGAAFGTALAVADVTADALSDVAVGAPTQPVSTAGGMVNGGMVFLFAADGYGRFQFLNDLREPGPSSVDRFGARLRFDDVDGIEPFDLTVAIPGSLGQGRIKTYYSAGQGDFMGVRRFKAQVPEVGGNFGTGFAWHDLNLDGWPDLLAGTPDTVTGGTLDLQLVSGEALPAVSPPQAYVGRTGRITTRTFTGSVPEGSTQWEVIGGGNITADGVYTPPNASTDRLSTTAHIALSDGTVPDTWGFARVHMMKSTELLTAPEVILDPDTGAITVGQYPEEGIHFGSSLTIAPLGRSATDTSFDKPVLLGSFPADRDGLVPRINGYPYFDADPPFSSIRPYPGQLADDTTGWGHLLAHGDFDGDGDTDMLVSAPYARSSDGNDPKTGFFDIYHLDAEGAPTAITRITPSSAMLAPDSSPLWTADNPRANTRYGFRLLVYDLNGDGRDDIIVGAPHADVYGLRDAGLVEVLLAPATGTWNDGTFIRATLAAGTPEEGGYFGSSLAVGDLSGNGLTELFVGAPGRDPMEFEDLIHAPSVVYAFEPATWDQPSNQALRNALNAATVMAVSDPNIQPNGRYSGFGLEIAVADFIPEPDNPDGSTPPPADELVVGAPFHTMTDPVKTDFRGTPTQIVNGGEVRFYDGAGGLAVVDDGLPLTPPMHESGMRYGARIISGQFIGDGSGSASLAIAAPFLDTRAGIDTGVVFLFQDTGSGAPVFRTRIIAPDARPSDLFGTQMTAGDLNQDGADELAIAAPNTDIRILIGYAVYPGRFGRTEEIIELRKKAGKVYVIFPDLP